MCLYNSTPFGGFAQHIKRCLPVVFFSFLTCFSTHIFSQQNYSITINDIPKQKLLSIGSSSVGIQDGVPSWATEAMADSIYNSLGTNALRLWANTEQKKTADDMLSDFDYYINSGILDAARKRGVKTLLLAPMRYGETPSEPMEEYTEKMAEFLRRVKSERGVVFNATGVANEPGFTVAQMTEAVKLLRKKLDNKGLSNIGIVAPEASSADEPGFSLVKGIKDDPIAWDGLLGIASHSYNMAANKQWENSITGTGKQYWMTEASDNGNETANDDTRAATIAARFLNDMNHLVDNWYYFIGYSSSSNVTNDGDNATKLMVYDFGSGSIFTTLKYYYFKQIKAVFDYNAVFRDAVSATEGDMVYTYGQKPAINCAAAKNPDGTWGIGAVNLTGIQAGWYGESFYPATNYNVTITVKELTNVPVASFRLYRSSGAQRFFNDGLVTMRNGSVTIPISPKEFVCLRQTSSTSTKADQSINFFQVPDRNLGDAPFVLSATASSNLGVSFRVVSGPASISGSTVTLTDVGTVVIEASQAGNSDFNAATNVTQSFVVHPAGTPSPCAGTGHILYEQWNNIGGNTLNDISFLQASPSFNDQLSLFEGPTNVADNYGSRIRGYICVPASGYYTFWIAGDDASQLWLSPDENPLNKVKIAEVLSWTNPREWNKFSSQRSGQIFLQSGQKYYVEALHKEGGGGDNLAVQWQMPNGVMESPIPGSRLLPYSSGTVTPSNQTINFQSIADHAFGSSPFDISASASSGLPVTFRVISGPATISGTKVTLLGAGSVVVEASQPGNASFNAAPVVTQSFTVTKADQTVNFGSLAPKVLGDAPFVLSAAASSGLGVNFRVVSGPASISGSTVTLTDVGTVVIEASQAGNSDFNAATNVTQSLVVNPAGTPSPCAGTGHILYEQWNNTGGNTLGDISFLQSSPSINSQLSLFEGPTDVADNYGSRIRGYICPPTSGYYTFWISGDDASQLWLSTDENPLKKVKIAYVLDWTAPREWNKFSSQKSGQIFLQAGQKYYVEALHKEGNGGDNLAVQWQMPNGVMESPIPGSRLLPYAGGPVTPSNQTISFQSIPDRAFGSAPFDISASASSGLPVSYRVVSGPASISGSTVTLTDVGTVVIEASQAGNSDFNAATNVTQSFVVNPAGTPSPCAGTGHILYEQWNNTGGNTLGDISFLQSSPSINSQLSLFEGPTDVADNYGSRIRGYICPPTSGYYTFWIAGDDASQLWLSTDDNAANKVKIAYVLDWTAPREWSKFSSQRSGQIFLQSGQKYYVEALHKEGNGGDNLAVQWQMPNGVMESPIPGSRLLPYSSGTVTPSNQTINFQSIADHAFGSAPFDISASASSGLPVTFRVISGPASISGSTVTLTDVGTVVIEASQAGNSNFNAATNVTQSFVVNPAGTPSPCAGTGHILYEQWNNTGGNTLGDISFLQSSPSINSQLSLFEGPTDVADNYGSRIRGYICPPTSGYYTFWIAGDDASQLWLSTDDNGANKVKIAYVLDWTAPREWNKFSSQKSGQIFLQAGQKYYVEALHKEGNGGDNLAVQWQMPDGVMESPIPGSRLSPYMAPVVTSALVINEVLSSPVFEEKKVLSTSVIEEKVASKLSVKVFPNPVKSNSTIMVSVPESGAIKLELLDLQGRLLRSIFSGNIEAGFEHSFRCSSTGLADGVYIIRLTTKAKLLSQKITLIK